MLPRHDLPEMLQHVPSLDLPQRTDWVQAIGLDLPIVAINLPHRTDRWEALSRRMSAVGLDKVMRIPAVEGARLAVDHVAALLRAPVDDIEEAPCSHLALTRPAIGCFLSHLAVWRWVVRNNVARALIFEDDAAPASHFDPARFRTVLAGLPERTGMVFLGRIIMNGMAERDGGSGLARIYYFNGTFAYLITPAACRTLIQKLLPLDRHLDHQISKVLIEQRQIFHAYYCEPHFFEPDWSLRSDCYVPISKETEADGELGELLDSNRRLLLSEGRPLLPAN
jgi:GR25 family glycosyltransferase involved in LPS biosynthesis